MQNFIAKKENRQLLSCPWLTLFASSIFITQKENAHLLILQSKGAQYLYPSL
ncbi:hypothetical protein X559_3103 [Paenilisteria newyorkensis]|nr:hypothetical protein X559_3103 [Listeria newyorkensis]